MSAKLCVHCAHFVAPPMGMTTALHATCKRYRQPPSLVDGSLGMPRLCDSVRGYADLCGPDGVGFERATAAQNSTAAA